MCGIAGFIAGHGAANAAALAPMLARIAHRGPDGQGTFVEGPAALGHCRLAIIDLEGGAQPLYSEDKNLVVVFNGEIYNYRALTAELTALGHTFATRTDTEVLLHGWEQWGRELLPRRHAAFVFQFVRLDAFQIEQAADAHHEELVEVALIDGGEGQTLAQRHCRVLGLLEDAFVEFEPGQLPVHEDCAFFHGISSFRARACAARISIQLNYTGFFRKNPSSILRKSAFVM